MPLGGRDGPGVLRRVRRRPRRGRIDCDSAFAARRRAPRGAARTVSVWRRAAELARAGAGGALATVARTTGSTPVPVGTKMLIGSSGRLEGTVGGGCVEADVLEAAQAAAGVGPVIRTHHLNADLAGDLGLSCGGTV